MDILVTGGAGFIGSRFVEMALSDEFPEIEKVYVLDKLTYAGNLSNLKQVIGDSNLVFQEGDICDETLVRKLTSKVDSVLNFAAESHVDRSIMDPKSFVMTNILGSQVLLDACREQKVSHYIQISTDEVYGSITEGSWDESFPLSPNSPYSASKASADLLAISYFKTYEMDIRVTRCSNNFGPRQNQEKLIPNFVNKLKNKERVPLYGDGENVRDWLYVDDHCQGIYLVLTKGLPGNIYNIGGGTELSNIKLTELILEHLELSLDYIEFVADRPGHDQRYSVDWSKIKALGYAPQSNFRNSLNKTIDWFLSNS